MCFVFDIEDKRRDPLTASVDIRVFKVLRKGTWLSKLFGISSMMFYFYRRFVRQPTVELEVLTDYLVDKVEAGYHSYDDLKVAMSYMPQGFAVFEFVIPAGSKYFYCYRYREYVSSNIRVKSFKPIKYK